MKTITKIAFILLLIGQVKAFAAICEATNGWKVTTQSIIGHTGVPARVPGNTLIGVYDDNDQLVVGFSAYSWAMGREPRPGQQDIYKIATTFQDKIGLQGFGWARIEGCPRCPADWDQLPSFIRIQSSSGKYHLTCKE